MVMSQEIKKVRLLLVDDDRLVLTTMAAGLRQAGYLVDEADSGARALELCAQARPDLAVLDVRMSGLSGVEVAERLQEYAIPFLFLTAYGEEELVRNAVKLGALGYLVKPIDIQQIVPELEAALGRAAEIKNLRIALDQKRETSVAIGILMERHHLTSEQAFEQLRNLARSQRRKVVEVAAAIVMASEQEHE
jgi:response regulator NasT